MCDLEEAGFFPFASEKTARVTGFIVEGTVSREYAKFRENYSFYKSGIEYEVGSFFLNENDPVHLFQVQSLIANV